MPYETIRLEQAVLAALDGLDPSERGVVLSEIYSLIDFPSADPTRFRTRVLRERGPVRALETTAGVWAIFQTDEARRAVEVIDLIRPQALVGLDREAADPVASP